MELKTVLMRFVKALGQRLNGEEIINQLKNETHSIQFEQLHSIISYYKKKCS